MCLGTTFCGFLRTEGFAKRCGLAQLPALKLAVSLVGDRAKEIPSADGMIRRTGSFDGTPMMSPERHREPYDRINRAMLHSGKNPGNHKKTMEIPFAVAASPATRFRYSRSICRPALRERLAGLAARNSV